MATARKSIVAGIAAIIIPWAGITKVAATTVVAEIKRHLTEVTGSVRDSGDFRAPGVRIRAAANTSAPVRGHGNPGDSATLHRKVTGERTACPDGTPSADWWEITNQRTQVRGYVSACYV